VSLRMLTNLKLADLRLHNRDPPAKICQIPHCLDNRLTDGGKVVSPKHRPRSTPLKLYFIVSGTHFC
jgi:hypothetical protein